MGTQETAEEFYSANLEFCYPSPLFLHIISPPPTKITNRKIPEPEPQAKY